MPETWVQSLSWKDPLEKEMAANSSIFTLETLLTKEPGELRPVESQKSETWFSD